jgi:hypothetical protein
MMEKAKDYNILTTAVWVTRPLLTGACQ